MAGLLLRLRTWWETADRTQKAVTIFGSVFLVLLLGGTFYFASKPHMALAFNNLDSAEVGTVSDEIQKMGIPVEYDVQGNVQVPSDKVAEVRAKLAEAGKLPSAGHMGDDLTKIGLLNTPSVEQERLKSIQQSQLAEAIENIKGVEKAEVQLNLGEKTPFADNEKPATASVQVSLAPDQTMSNDQGHVIAMLVANSVTGLSADHVFVSDNAGHTLYDGSTQASDSGLASQKIQEETAEAKRRENELQQKLDAAFGRGNTLVTVNLELDYDKTKTHSDIHPRSKAEAAVESTTTETMSGDTGVAGGVAGMKSNITPATPTTPSDKKYDANTSQVERPIDEIVTDKDASVGGLKSMAITALVNQAKIPNAAQVDTFLQGYLKPWAGDAHFTETSTLTAFDTTAQDIAVKAQKDSAARDRFQQIISMLPIAALLFVGFMVAKAISKAAKPKLMAALPGGGMLPLEMGAEGGYGEGEGGAHGEGGVDGSDEHMPSLEDIGPIQEKLNLPLEQIKKMSDDKPDNVALLIKSWMMEDHR